MSRRSCGRLARDVLTTGEGYVELELDNRAPPPERPAEPSPPPDWALLHLAHGEQVSSAQEIWDAVAGAASLSGVEASL